MFKLASLIVEIVAQTDSLDRALSRTHANLSTVNVALGTFAGNVAASFARMAVGAAGGLFEGTVRSASHLAETMNKTRVVLGEGADKIIANADDMAERFGFVKKEVLDASSSFALLGKEMKMSEAASADFGIKLTRMAADAGSLADIELPAMLEKLRAGLAGQVRPLRELGIFMTADAVKAEAARMGLKPGESGQLSEGDKIKARVSFIENSEFMKKASGDLARTLGETENQTRKFWGTLSNLGTSIGQELNPAWNRLLQDLNAGVDSLKTMFESNKSVVRSWGDAVVENFETATLVWRNLPDVLEMALLGADQKLENALAATEVWATKTAVAIEKAYLGASKGVGGFVADVQTGSNMALATQVEAAGKLASVAQSAAGGLSKGFDSWMSEVAKKMDIMFRPVRDASNFIERKTGLDKAAGPGYKQMSVEEDVGQLKGSLSGLAPALGGIGQFLGMFKENLLVPVKPKVDEENALIAKADKHLADVMGENTDVSSKAIAAVSERIRKREADRLAALANTMVTDEEMGEATSRAELKKRSGKKRYPDDTGDEDELPGGITGKKKHQKTLEDSAKFAETLAAGQLGGDVQEKQLTELQLIREADQKNADMMERMLQRQARAVFA